MKGYPKVKLELILRGITQSDVAKHIGCSKEFVNAVLAGTQKPSERVVQGFLDFGIRLEGENGSQNSSN